MPDEIEIPEHVRCFRNKFEPFWTSSRISPDDMECVAVPREDYLGLIALAKQAYAVSTPLRVPIRTLFDAYHALPDELKKEIEK